MGKVESKQKERWIITFEVNSFEDLRGIILELKAYSLYDYKIINFVQEKSR